MNPTLAGISAVPGGIALLLLLVFTFLYQQTRDAYFRAWQFAWAAYFISRLSLSVYFAGYPYPWVELVSNIGFVLMAVFIFRSTRIIDNDKRWHRADSILLGMGILWSAYDVMARVSPERWQMIGFGSWRISHPPVETACAPFLVIAGIRFWRQARLRESRGYQALAFSLWFWSGLLATAQFHAFFYRMGVWGHVLGPIPQMLLGIAMVMVQYETVANAERRRSRYLAFLNSISRTAISNRDAKEMLGEIGSEIRRNFSFDHIGIAVVDYTRKDMEIRVDAGTAVNLSGSRIPLGAGIIGQVAHNSEMILAQGAGQREGTLLPNARSVLCAPILHNQAVLGVLNIESSAENAFEQPEVLILRTLADLLAAALHNAFVFQGMQQQAITDSLTGNKTRRYFLEALQAEWKRALRSGRPFSVVMVDLDKFKDINDSRGHMEGDLVIATVGRVLEHHCRQSNVVARYGGDEFVILMPETTLEQSLVLSERLRAWLSNDPTLKERTITGSFGVASFPMHGESPDAILQAADAALYAAKHRGGNCVETATQATGAAI